jgi:hypothetical protein
MPDTCVYCGNAVIFPSFAVVTEKKEIGYICSHCMSSKVANEIIRQLDYDLLHGEADIDKEE